MSSESVIVNLLHLRKFLRCMKKSYCKGTLLKYRFFDVQVIKALVKRDVLESLSFTYTENGKRQIQVENFSK